MTKSYICGTGAMKKKAKKKSGKKSTKESKKATEKKELDPAEVLKEISAMIKQEAPEIAKAVIGEGKRGSYLRPSICLRWHTSFRKTG